MEKKQVSELDIDNLCNSFAINSSFINQDDEWGHLKYSIQKLKFDFEQSFLTECAETVIRYKYTFGDTLDESSGYNYTAEIKKGIDDFFTNWGWYKNTVNTSLNEVHDVYINGFRSTLISLFELIDKSITEHQQELEEDMGNFARMVYDDSQDEDLDEDVDDITNGIRKLTRR